MPGKNADTRGVVRLGLRPLQILALAAAAFLMLLVAVRYERLDYSRHLQELHTASVIDIIELRENIEEEIFGNLLVVEKLEAVIAEYPDLAQRDFERIASGLVQGHPGVVSVAASQDMVIRLIYPLEPNREALGFDYRTNETQLAQVARARDAGETIVVGPIDLVQGGTGLIMRSPVLLPDGRIWGIASLVLDYEVFAQRILTREYKEALDILIYEQTPSGNRFIYGEEAVIEREPATVEIDFPGGAWYIAATPQGGWPTHAPGAFWDRLVDALVIILALGVLTYILYLSEARRLARLRLSDAIEAMDDGFALFDGDERLVMSNSRYRDIYDPSRSFLKAGTRFEDIIRSGMARGMHPEAEGREEAWIQDRLTAFRGVRTNTEQVLASGRTMKVADRRTSDGGTVGLRVDVTELKKAMEEAEAASQAKTRFISVLSHELRTPLTVILGNVRLTRNFERTRIGRDLLASIDDPEADRATVRANARTLLAHTSGVMEKLEESGTHLLSLINEMLDFAKIESGTLSVELSTCSISDIVRPVEDQIRPAIEQKGLRFVVEACDCTVRADEGRSRQILYNLIGNALKFTEAGSISLRVERAAESVGFIVEDTGPGIAAEDAERVFEAFQQADSSLSRNSGGTGLGLAISRQLALAQGGTLELQSAPGSGSRFILTLPSSTDSSSDGEQQLAA